MDVVKCSECPTTMPRKDWFRDTLCKNCRLKTERKCSICDNQVSKRNWKYSFTLCKTCSQKKVSRPHPSSSKPPSNGFQPSSEGIKKEEERKCSKCDEQVGKWKWETGWRDCESCFQKKISRPHPSSSNPSSSGFQPSPEEKIKEEERKNLAATKAKLERKRQCKLAEEAAEKKAEEEEAAEKKAEEEEAAAKKIAEEEEAAAKKSAAADKRKADDYAANVKKTTAENAAKMADEWVNAITTIFNEPLPSAKRRMNEILEKFGLDHILKKKEETDGSVTPMGLQTRLKGILGETKQQKKAKKDALLKWALKNEEKL